MQQGAIYRETWPPTAELYAGQVGPFPREGDPVAVYNFWTETSKQGRVTETDRRRRTYIVALDAEPRQIGS